MAELRKGTWPWSETIGILVFISAIASLWFFVDWNGDIEEAQVRYESCVEAENSLGDSIYAERPDCREVLEPRR